MAEEAKSAPKVEMEYRVLGNTGLKVSALGFGTMTLTSAEQAEELISTVRNCGVNFFDNAELYGSPRGAAEAHFGEALKRLQKKDPALYRRSELVITAKLFFGTGDGNAPQGPAVPYAPNEFGLSRKHIVEGMKGSLERLQLDYVDVVYCHRYDHLTPMEEIVRGFTHLINSGQALYWGTSMWPAQKVTEAYWVAKVNALIPPVVEQPMYNMFVRQFVEMEYLEMYAAPYKLGLTTWSPLDSGVLTGKYVKEVPADSRLGDKKGVLGSWYGAAYAAEEKNDKVVKLMEVAKEMGVSMVSLAIGWIIKNKHVSCCMLGGRKPHQLEANMSAIEAAKKLTPALMKKIDGILGNKPRYNLMHQPKRVMRYITDPL